MAVFIILRLLSLSFTSQVHPEPNTPNADLVNSSLNFSTEPNAEFILSDSVDGISPCSGVRDIKKKVWFHVCAALLNVGP